MTAQSGTIDDPCINTIRVLSIDAVEQAASGKSETFPTAVRGARASAFVLTVP